MQVAKHTLMTSSFSLEDAQEVQMPHDDTLVIETVIHNFKVRKVLVDDGNKVNLLSYWVSQQMKMLGEQLIRDQAPVKGIAGTPIVVEGKVKVALNLGEPLLLQTHYECSRW